MRFIFIMMTLLSTSLFALEIDEKLTTRFLKVSRSKKTVLINRGLEDGLVVGDHAKFFLTTGVIARGVVVKASPTRTIWSIYRIISDDQIFSDKVVNIKITRPIDTTADPSKSIYDNSNATMSAGTEVMTMRGGSRPPTVQTVDNLNEAEKDDLESLGSLNYGRSNEPGISPNKTIEAFGLIQFNSLSASVDEGNGDSFVGSQANIDFSLGLEKYFNSGGDFLQSISFLAIVHSGSKQVTSAQGQTLSSSVFEYGVGANYHFMGSPLAYNKLIGFAGFNVGVGSVGDTVEVLGSTSTQETRELSGTSSFFALSAGLKYYTESGFGLRALIDYYNRSESYVPDDEEIELTKVISGPRFLLGLAYKF